MENKMKYCVYQNNIVIDQDLTKPAAELIMIEHNCKYVEEVKYRVVEQTPRMERMWDGFYE